MSTSPRSHRRPVGRGMLGLAASFAVIATFLVPLAINPTPAFADTSAQIGTGVECANDNWQAETTADDAGHFWVCDPKAGRLLRFDDTHPGSSG